MRSSSWQYMGCVLIGVGGAFSIAALAILWYLQKVFVNSLRFSAYHQPMIFGGVGMIIAGASALIVSRTKREGKTQERQDLKPS